MSSLVTLGSLTIVLFILIGNLEALSWTVRHRSYEPSSCFYINVPEPSHTISVYYNVHESKSGEAGHLVDYVVAGPNGQQLMAEQGVNFKDFKVQPLMAGRHSICFKHNGTPTEKVLDIDVSLIKPENTGNSGKQTDLTGTGTTAASSPTAEIERVNRRVKEDLSSLYHSLLSQKDREKANHMTVKSILKVIKYFSIFQSLTVVVLGFAHIYVLKTFFSNNAKTRV